MPMMDINETESLLQYVTTTDEVPHRLKQNWSESEAPQPSARALKIAGVLRYEGERH
jgi:hypothetical protein